MSQWPTYGDMKSGMGQSIRLLSWPASGLSAGVLSLLQGKIMDSSFSPHLWLKVERDIPSQIFVVALVGVPKLLKVELPYLVSVDRIPQIIRHHYGLLREDDKGSSKVVTCFGRVLGYYYHYEKGKCQEYDVCGELIGQLIGIPAHYDQEATLEIDDRKNDWFIE